MRYRITLWGCDDHTTVQWELSSAEVDFVTRLAEATETASRYQCQPTLALTEAGDDEDELDDDDEDAEDEA